MQSKKVVQALAGLGIGPTEMVNIEVHDIDFRSNTVQIAERLVYLPTSVQQEIYQYLWQRKKHHQRLFRCSSRVVDTLLRQEQTTNI